MLTSTCVFVLISAPVASACETGSAAAARTGSTGGSSRLLVPGDINPIPWLNGRDGRLPELRGRTTALARLTGLRSDNDTIARFSVLGTDLGIMWDNGAGEVLTAFGDTFGFSHNLMCGLVGDWRSNILFRSSDRDLSDGMDIDSSPVDGPAHSKELIPSRKVPGVETTIIPTTGVAVDDIQYVNYMSVRSWGAPGEWITNASGIAYSTDNGETWTVDPLTTRVNLPTGNDNFQMGSYVKHDGFVYAFGTPAGRSGDARLSRVPETAIRIIPTYEYWNGTEWVPNDPAAAQPVIPGPVSELSVDYNKYLDAFVALYTDRTNSIVMRQAKDLRGPWTDPDVLVSGADVPELYGAYLHPWSEGPDLYYLASTWSDYNVMLLHTNLR